MAKLFGAQRMIVQAVNDLPRDASAYVRDQQVAQNTHISISDVRDWIETLEGEELIDVVRTTEGISTSITAKGRLQLETFRNVEPIPIAPHQDKRGDTSQPDAGGRECEEKDGDKSSHSDRSLFCPCRHVSRLFAGSGSLGC